MKVSTKGLYGALAVLDLAIHQTSAPVHKAAIAERQNIPEQYLAQLLSVLRRAGIVKSIRGPSGGHLLALSPGDISLLEVIELLDGPQIADKHTATGAPVSHRLVNSVLREADTAAADVLHGVTFDTLVERWKSARAAADYVI